MKYLNLPSKITQIEIELEVLDSFINQDIIYCNNFEYVALAYVIPREGLWLYIITIENKAWSYHLSCIEVKTCENGYYLAYLRVFVEEELKSCAYRFVVFEIHILKYW